MRNTSTILLTKIADEVVIKLLKTVIPALKIARIDYFAVGAFARDVTMLAKGHTSPPARKTNDVDLAVMVGSLEEYEELKKFKPEREKDILDIAYILKNFMVLHWEEIAADDLLDLYEDGGNLFDQLVSARYVGRQMGGMLQGDADLKKRVQKLLEEEAKRSGMARLMSNEYIEDNQRIITALLDGVNDISRQIPMAHP